MPSRWSIRIFLILLIVALLGPPLGLTVTLGYRMYRADLRKEEESLQQLADQTASGIAQFLADSRSLTEGIARTRAAQAMDPAACAPLSDDVAVVLSPLYSNLATWRSDGTPVCSVLSDPASGLATAPTPGFAEALTSDGFTLTPVQRGRRSGRWITVLTAPIRDAEGERVGMISLGLDLVRLEPLLARAGLPSDGVISVTQLDGTVVAYTQDADTWVGQSPPALDADSPADPAVSTRGLATGATFDGRDFQWGFVHVPGTSWIVYAGRPHEAIHQPARRLLLNLIFFGTVIIVGSIYLGIRLFRAVTGPLRALVEGIADMPRAGGLLPADGPAEIAWVAERFNRAWSERMEAERERARSEERALSVFENAVIGIAAVTEEGGFVEANQALVDMLGYPSREALLATSTQALCHDPEKGASPLVLHGHREHFRGISTTWCRLDGELLHVRLSGRAVTFPDGRRGWELFIEDVTEFTGLQARYAQLQKMDALGRLAGGVAHDFNNLLTVVQGQADLLRDDPALDGEQQQQVEEIIRAASRGAALNRQLLAFGRRSPSDKRLLDLNGVVRDFELVLRRALGEEIELQISLADDLGFVKADRSRVEQILMNLIVNARDAMPRGGAIALSTTTALVAEEEASQHPGATVGRHAVLSVADTGTGIPDDVLAHIFEPFFSTKPSSRGTGLGLATVYGIVADSGGHLRVHTRVGSGTEFQVYLPASDGVIPDALPEVTVRPVPAGTGMILLAEDEAGVRRLAQQILERAGYRVVAAADGREALVVAASETATIDLLITDVVMPGLRGPELAEALAASGKVRRAVFVSGYPEGLPEAGPAGIHAWHYLPKPFSANQLLEAVQHILSQES